MGGITVAPHITESSNDSFLASFNAGSTSLDNNSTVMDNLLPSTQGWPMEDLTGEVHDLMLRESMNWLPWMDENETDHTLKNLTPLEGFDSQLLAQTLQLDGLFGQEMNFDQLDEASSSLLYDEMTFDPSPVATPIPSPSEDHHQQQQQEFLEEIVPGDMDPTASPTPAAIDYAKDDSSTDDDSDDDSDDDDSENSDEEDGPVSVMTTTWMYLPKRQVEETLLSKITEHLQPDKLPGILSIVSSSSDDQEGEVEIDLSCLVREQLVRVMLYVDDCINEQQGGPKVKLSKYLVKESKSTRKETVVDDDDDDEDILGSGGDAKRKRRRNTTKEGPISMAALTKKSKSSTRKPSLDTSSHKMTTTPKRRRTRKKQQQQDVSHNGIASNRPKRRSALHKRRMLEEMLLVPSDEEDDDLELDQQVMVTYGEEQMDFGVVDNQTIVHQPQLDTTLTTSTSSIDAYSSIATHDDDEDDEEIDIM
ncbi:hypothetical protein BC941DRAFT_469902 [Chlamydoabsidia padenii]|nr:hypothetical protein BC941DRAFT_469902 [Chlamydoabsidia padenii]